MKKKLTVFISLLSVLIGVFTATTVYAAEHYTTNPETFTRLVEKQYMSMVCQPGWCATTTRKNDHENSLKTAQIRSYIYNENNAKYYIQYDSGEIRDTKLIVVTPTIVVGGSAARVRYYGDIYRTSKRESGVLQSSTVYAIRSGCPHINLTY